MSDDQPKKKSGIPCPKCGNRLRLRPDQLGEQVMCPKCEAKFVVGTAADARRQQQAAARKSADPVAAGSTPASDPADALVDTYEPEIPLERTWSVPESEMADISPLAARPAPYDVDWRVSDDLEAESPIAPPPDITPDYLQVAKAKGLMRDEHVDRPPRWTFFSGVFGYPWRGQNLSRWTAMAFGMSCAGAMTFATLSSMGLIPGAHGNPILGIFMSLIAVVMTLGSLSFVAASSEAALSDTALGYDEPQEGSVSEWDGWIFSLLGVAGLCALAAAPGYPLSLWIGNFAFLICGLLLFPVFWLAALEGGSYLVPFSKPVFATLLRRPGGWLIFYLLTTPLLVGWIAGFVYVFRQMPYLAIVLSGPVLAAVMLIYARLLGRVIWSAAYYGTQPGASAGGVGDEPFDDSPKRVRLRGKPPKRRRKIVIPGATDEMPAISEPPEPAPARPPRPAPGTAVPPPRLRFGQKD